MIFGYLCLQPGYLRKILNLTGRLSVTSSR